MHNVREHTERILHFPNIRLVTAHTDSTLYEMYIVQHAQDKLHIFCHLTVVKVRSMQRQILGIDSATFFSFFLFLCMTLENLLTWATLLTLSYHQG